MSIIIGIFLAAYIFTFIVNTAAADHAWDCAFKNNKSWLLWHVEDDGTSATDLIYDFYSPFSLKNWLGFRVYVRSFKIPNAGVCNRLSDEDPIT